MAEKRTPVENEEDITTAKERTCRNLDKVSTKRNIQFLKEGSDWETQSVSESVSMSSCNDEKQESPGPSVMSMKSDLVSLKSDQSMEPPVAFAGGCTVNIRVKVEASESANSSSFKNTDDSSFCHERVDGGVLCSVCPKKAIKSCLTCISSFCDLHVKQHYRAPAYQKHRLVEATTDLEQQVCLQHNRELELFCKTDLTPICVLCLATEHSGHEIAARGKNEIFQSNKTQMAPHRDQGAPQSLTPKDKTDYVKSFLSKLGLLQFYPNNLTLRSLLEVSNGAVVGKELKSLQDVPLAFLRKLLMVNTKCWNYASPVPGKTQKRDESDDEDDDDDDDDKFHPLDLVTALYLCADSFLQQEMSIKMSMCQFAVPFLLPQFGDHHCTFMLWALRNIYKEWRPHDLMHTKSYVEDSVVHAQMPLLSFVRLSNCSLSKSQLLNHVLSNAQQSHNFFTHRDMNGGNSPKKIAKGLVEIVWCLPCGQSNIDVFPEAVAITNMRGEISSNETQFRFLMEVSAAVFVFVDTMTQEEESLLDRQGPLKSKLFLVVHSQEKRLRKNYANALKLQRNQILWRKPQLNMAESSSLILEAINMVLKECKKTVSIETLSDTASKLGISVDEKTNKSSIFARNSAKDIMQGIGVRQIVDYKKKQLPLQGKYLKKKAWIELEECRLQHVGDLSLEEYKTQLMKKKCELREQQGAIKTSQAMEKFIQTMSSEDKEERSLFLRWMALQLDRNSRKHLKDVRRKFKEVYQEKDNKLIVELDQQLLDNSLGIEHYMREMGQIYESKQSGDTKHLPSVAAELLLDGYPIELLDGDTSTIAEKWMTAVLMEVHRKVGEHSRLLVVSVLGVQSTGKSTLLNTMFGVQFPACSGRCTRGAYMLFLAVGQQLRERLKCDFLLLIDTEGLKSPELADLDSSHEHDNQLATLVIGLSDVTIINMAMENAAEMKDVLQIAVHAFLRMKQLGKKPICHFVHQNVSGVSAHDKLMTDRKHLLDQLDEMTRIAADMENQPEVKKFTDVLDYDVEKNNWYIPGLWHGTPPMAPVNSGYSEAVHEFKQKLLQSDESIFLEHLSEIPDFLEWMSSLWNAVKHENFIFSFRNTLVAFAYDSLCKEFSEWEWSFRKTVYTWLNNAETQISNTDISKVDNLNKDLKSVASKLIEDQTAEMNKKLKQYYKHRDKYAHLVEKHRGEFQINIKSLQKQMNESVENKLLSAVCLKKDMEQVETLRKQHRERIETQVVNLLKSCQGKSTELSDSDLEEEFQKMWRNVTVNITPLEKKDVSSCVMRQLRDNLSHRGVQEKLLKISDLTKCGCEAFRVRTEYISGIKYKFMNKVMNMFTEKSIKGVIQTVADNIIEHCVRYIEGVVGTKTDYQDILAKEILHKIDTGLRETAKKTTTTFEADLKVHICGIAARRFLEMHQNYLLDKHPQKHLERSKEKYLLDFIDSYRKNDLCLRKAQDFTQQCIKPAVIDYMNKSLGIEIVDGILASTHSAQYSSRSYFQYTILSELLEKDDFEKFVRYIFNYENFVKDWIDHQVVEWLSKGLGLVKLKSQILRTLIQKITERVKVVQGEVNDLNTTNEAGMFVEKLCHALSNEISLPKNNVREVIFQMSSKSTPFIDSLLLSLDELGKQLDKEFAESNDIKDTLNILTIKPQDEIFERVCGCGKLCPFCMIPCEAGGKAHTQHHAAVHRPQGLGGYMYTETETLFEVLCTTCVYSDAKFQNHDTDQEIHPYKKYRKYYPNWNIAPDPSIQASDYWKYVLVRYNDKFAEKYQAKPAVCPVDWLSITKEQALEGLKSAFNVK